MGRPLGSKNKKKGGRPFGAKTASPVIATDEYALDFVKKRSVTIADNPLLTPLADKERDYLLGTLEVFRMRVEPTIGSGETLHGNCRYTPKQMWDAIMKYFEVTLQHGQPLTISSLSMFTGYEREQLAPSNIDKLPAEYGFLKECVKFIETYIEFTGQKRNNPAFNIFWLKNRGWKDKYEIEATANQGALSDKEREEAQLRIAKFTEEIVK